MAHFELIETPQPGSVWRHVRSARMYEVLGVTNRDLPAESKGKPGREVMVVYRNMGRADWLSRPLADWNTRFKHEVTVL